MNSGETDGAAGVVGSTRTNCATPQRLWPSPPEPMRGWCSRCSDKSATVTLDQYGHLFGIGWT